LVLTDDEVIEKFNELNAQKGFHSRFAYSRYCHTTPERLVRLDKEGRIKLPAKVGVRNKAHYKKSDKWRNFTLPGSPVTGARKKGERNG